MASGMIAVSCPECGTSIRLHEADWAEGIPCPACTSEIRQPTEEELKEKKLAELKDQLKILDDQFVEMQEQCSSLQTKAKTNRETAVLLEQDCHDLEARLSTIGDPSAASEGAQRVAELERRLRQVREEIRLTREKAKDQLDNLTERANKAVQERIERAADQMHETYTVSRRELVGELTTLASETEALRGDLARRENELDEHERETVELRSKLEEVQSCLRIAENATSVAESRAAELGPKAVGIDKAVSRDDLERIRTSNQRQLRQLPAIQDHHARLESYVADLKARLAAAQPAATPTPEATAQPEPAAAAPAAESPQPEKEAEPRPRQGTVRLKPMKRNQ